MARERAYTDEERPYRPEERRPESPWPHEADRERRRWEMAKGSAEREYGDRGQPDYGYGGRRAQWMQPGPFKGRGPKGYTRNDETIREDISERLMEDGQIDASGIEVEVRQGVVMLRGYVNSRFAKRSADDIADSVPGVKDVQNELRVAEYGESGMGQTAASAAQRDERREPGETRERGREARGVGGANLSVFGIYRDRPAVEQAVEALKSAGFRSTDISVLFPYNEGTKDFAFEKGTKAPEGVVAGGASGIVVGGVLGWLVGIGLLAVPGLGPFLAAGPIVATLAGMGIAGTVGGIAGALIGMGIPEYEAKRYEGRVKSGHVLLSVHSDDRNWADRAEQVLERTGGEDISRTGEESADFAETDKPLPRGSEYRRE